MPPILAAAPLEVRTTRRRGRAVVHLTGDLDVVGSRRLRDAVVAVLDRDVWHVDVDVSELGFVDAAGLGAYLSTP